MTYFLFLAFTLSLFGLYVIGLIVNSIFLKIRMRSFFEESFFNLFFGVLSFTTIWAIYKTNGKTVLFPILIFSIILIWNRMSKPKWFLVQFKPNLFQVLNLFIGFIIAFTFYIGIYIDDFSMIVPHFDDPYYAYTSSKIGFFGSETTMPIIPNRASQHLVPYHYFELWFSDGLSSIYNVKHLIGYGLLTKALLVSCAFVGYWAISTVLTTNKILIALSPFLLTFSSILIDYSSILQGATLIHQSKMLVACLFYMMTILLYLKRSPFYLLPIVISPLVSVALFPISVFLIVLFYLFKLIDFSSRRLIFAGVIFVSLWMLGFYKINQLDIFQLPLKCNLNSYFFNFRFFVLDITNELKRLIMYFPYLLILVCLLHLSQPKMKVFPLFKIEGYKNLRIIIILILCIALGLLLSFLMTKVGGENSAQFHLLSNVLALNLIIGVAFVYTMDKCLKGNLLIRYFSWFSFLSMVCYIFSIHVLTRIKEYNDGDLIVFNSKSQQLKHSKCNAVAIFSNPSEYSEPNKMSTRSELVNAYKLKNIIAIFDVSYSIDLSHLFDYNLSSEYVCNLKSNKNDNRNLIWRLLSGQVESEFLDKYVFQGRKSIKEIVQLTNTRWIFCTNNELISDLLEKENIDFRTHKIANAFILELN